jgi:hypothetical protein
VIESLTDQIGLTQYALYVFDYGAPVGFRLAASRPERITALISQNGNAYEEGLSDGWNPIRAYWQDPTEENRGKLRAFLRSGTTLFQYTHGEADATLIAPESYTLDQHFLDRQGNDEIQLDLFGDYKTNVASYPRFHEYFRMHRPPTLAVWGKNDPFFLPKGAEAYRRDIPDAEIHFVDAGHFPLETHLDEIAGIIRGFLARKLDRTQGENLFGPLTEASVPSTAKESFDGLRGVFGFVPNLGYALAAEWAEYMPIIGIECVGEVVNAPGGEFNPGDKVAAFVGGLGRTLNGSYAEFNVAPVTNVIKVETTLPWEEFAALPESYATAWVALNANLEIKKGQTLLIRGATSALGQAALNIAVDAGLNVIATTRSEAKFGNLLAMGAKRVELEGPDLSKRLKETKHVDSVLDLVGNSVLKDSLAIPHRGGRVP